jgi:uncharacterized protein VirK/YbjX
MTLNGKQWGEEHRVLLARLKAAVARDADGDVRQEIAELADLTQRNRRYLARSLDKEAQRACAEFHYRWMSERFAPAALAAMLGGRIEIWSATFDGVAYAFMAFVEPFCAREGAFTLELYANGTTLYGLSFTVVPGRLFEREEDAVFLVSRIQGRPDRYEEIKSATRAMADVSPRAALFAVLAGVAQAVGINLVLGVSAENFINYLPQNREALERQYDAFYQSLEASGPQSGIYVVDLRAEPKPVTEIKAGHRIRTRRKRQFKQQLAAAVAQSFAARVAAPQREVAG